MGASQGHYGNYAPVAYLSASHIVSGGSLLSLSSRLPAANERAQTPVFLGSAPTIVILGFILCRDGRYGKNSELIALWER